MNVILLQDNLMWSAKLERSLRSLGHQVVVKSNGLTGEEGEVFDVAIVNLGGTSFEPEAAIATLKGLGTYVIAHAGHKEKAKLKVGKESQADRVATNSEVTFKIEKLLQDAGA